MSKLQTSPKPAPLTIPPRLLWFLKRSRPYAIPLAVSTFIAYVATRLILRDGHQPGMPLDDSYIHFVYARRFAEGHPFTFGLGDGFSSGATSFLWPLVLSPFWLIGFRGLSLIYVVWVLGTLLHAAVAVETKRLAEGIAGKAAGAGAAAMCLLFGAFAWFAWSGMETIALTWAMVRTLRMASEYAEASGEDRTRKRALQLAIMAAIAALLRPEGGFIGLVAAGVIVLFPGSWSAPRAKLTGRLPAVIPVLAVGWVPVLNYLMVGHTRSTTTMVKWAVGNPYYQGPRLWEFVSGNVKMLTEDLLSGGPFTAIFIPEYSHYAFLAGAVSLAILAYLHDKAPRGVMIAALNLATLIPCTFITILWNRVRYIYPFAPGWFVLVACLGGGIGELIARFYKDAAWVGALVSGVYAGGLAGKLSWSIADLANSSRAITEQQVKLGMWAEKNLPKNARIGLNDTGAIAYFSERKTFDVVGLTTEGEAPYWVAGAGSRYEHYERMGSARLPTHFIIYPQWFACPSVLGEQLYEATVLNQSILGGASKVVYEADWTVLNRGDRPTLRDRDSALVDELDVADLESESDHAYALNNANDGENQVTTSWDETGEQTSDGGRVKRWRDDFTLTFDGAESPLLVARMAASQETVLTLSIDGVPFATFQVPNAAWAELDIPLPKRLSGKHAISIAAQDPQLSFGSMHYWLFEE